MHLPIGFAGGLRDADTRLVRFGFRDYDPEVGRFTCLDPLGDTGGDHDLYDYCVDDPVSTKDETGLFAPLLILGGLALGKLVGLGIGLGGSYLAAKAVDKMQEARTGEKSTAAVDGVTEVMPKTALISLGSVPGGLAPAVIVEGAGMAVGAARGVAQAYTHIGQAAGAAVETSKHGNKIIKGAPHLKDFIEGAVMPGTPAMTVPGGSGYIARRLYDEAKKRK